MTTDYRDLMQPALALLHRAGGEMEFAEPLHVLMEIDPGYFRS